MARRDAVAALPAPAAARALFERAAASFDRAKHVHDECRRRLLDRLDLVRLDPDRVVDIGCATADGAAALARRYPRARVLAVDASPAMLRQARRRHAATAAFELVAGDAERLPLPDRSIDLLFANLLLPWCRPDAVFAEAARVLGPGGLFLFATLGPDSLQQIRRAWAGVDERVHVHAFYDMHDLGDAVLAAGLQEPVIDVDRLEVSYRELSALVADLRACGGVNIAAGRRRELTGPARWRRFVAAMTAARQGGRFRVGLELVFGQAWRLAENSASRGGHTEVRVPIDRLLGAGRRAH